MVGIHNNCRILQLTFCVHINNDFQHLIMVVGEAVADGVNITAQNRMRQRIALSAYLPATEQKFLLMLRRRHTVEHNGQIAAGRILHANGNAYAAGNHTVELVLAGACADCGIAQQIGQIAENLRIENFLRTGQTGFFYHAHVHFADSDNTAQHILFTLGRRLVQHTLIAYADSTRLVGVQTRYDKNFVLHLFLQLGQTINIVQHSVLVIAGAGTDNQQKAVILACKNILYSLVTLQLQQLRSLTYRIILH